MAALTNQTKHVHSCLGDQGLSWSKLVTSLVTAIFCKMIGRVTKYRINNDAPSEVFEAASEQERKDRLLSYAERVEKRLDVRAVQSDSDDPNELVFDLVGVDASIANALRRILLAEVATVAIEHVYMFMNSSIIHDEILAHRLGLIPIMANPRMFEFMGEEGGEQDEPTEFNTCVFKLEVKNPSDPADVPDPMPRGTSYAAGPRRTMNVFSGAMEWCPHGAQVERFEEDGGLRPVHDDILIAKLRPGQEIVAEMHCRKGVGKDHAKFSPVATASYRLLPVITLKEDVEGEEAEELVAKCPLNVFDIEDLGGGDKRATVARPRDCTMCRECIREPGWSDKVSLTRIADHFIFGIESVGMLPPKELLKDSIQVLRQKCDVLIGEVEAFESGIDFDEAMP
eukprot:jgi/Undpi1/6015/HiC_scaffold_2.g01289.m1